MVPAHSAPQSFVVVAVAAVASAVGSMRGRCRYARTVFDEVVSSSRELDRVLDKEWIMQRIEDCRFR